MQNAIRRLVVLKGKGSVGSDDLAMAGLPSPAPSAGMNDVEPGAGPDEGIRLTIDLAPGTSYRTAVQEAKQAVTEAVLKKHCGNVTAAARELGISKDTWYRVRSLDRP